MMGALDQQRRAREIVSGVLGIYAISTPASDPTAKFGYECALAAIIKADEEKRLIVVDEG